ncbi:MAG: PAS domain S-box protein, partial [Cyanobacteria bacterium J06638_6]
MSTCTILCVDDERNVLLTLRSQLMRHFQDFAIEIAESGAEALKLINAIVTNGGEVPLVVADQIMPGMRGDELLIELHDRYPQMIKVMLTGQAQAEDVVKTVNRGHLYRFLSKPWHEADLTLTITEGLRRYWQEQQIAQQQIALDQANQKLTDLSTTLEQQVDDRTQTLKSALDFNQQIIATVQEGLIVWDQTLSYRVWNRFMEDLSGLPATTVLDQHYLDLFPFLQENGISALLQRALAGETVFAPDAFFEVPSTGKSGWTSERFTPLRDTQGKIVGVLGTVHDITERKQAELSLRESEHKHRTLANALPDLIIHMNSQGVYLDFFDSVNLNNFDDVKLGLDASHQGFPADLAERRMGYIQQALATGEQQTYEQVFSVDNTQVIEEVRVVPLNKDEVLVIVRDITDRKRAEEALRESEAQNRAILSSIPDIITVLDTEGRYVSCTHNQFTGEVLSVADELVGKLLPEVLPPQMLDQWSAALEEVLATGEMQDFEQQLRFGDRIQYEEVRMVPYQSERVLCIVRNISAEKAIEAVRQQAEAALQKSAASLAEAQRIAQVGNWELDLATQTLSWSEELFRLYGRDVAQGQPTHNEVRRQIPPEDWPVVEQVREQAIAAGLPYTIEHRVMHPNGDLHYVLSKGVPQVNAEGQVVKLFGTTQDITEAKQAQDALRASERRYATLAEAAPVGIFRFDPAGDCIYVNQYWSEITGWSTETALGKSWIQPLHPEDRDRIRAEWAKALEQDGFYRSEGRYLRPDGTTVWFCCQMLPETDASGVLTGYVGTITDISDLKQAETALRHSEAKQRA